MSVYVSLPINIYPIEEINEYYDAKKEETEGILKEHSKLYKKTKEFPQGITKQYIIPIESLYGCSVEPSVTPEFAEEEFITGSFSRSKLYLNNGECISIQLTVDEILRKLKKWGIITIIKK